MRKAELPARDLRDCLSRMGGDDRRRAGDDLQSRSGVPRGRGFPRAAHQVAMRFRPSSARNGLILSGLSAVAILLVCGRRKKNSPRFRRRRYTPGMRRRDAGITLVEITAAVTMVGIVIALPHSRPVPRRPPRENHRVPGPPPDDVPGAAPGPPRPSRSRCSARRTGRGSWRPSRRC